MTTFIKKKLKDREGNYLVTPSSADIVYCSDGETVATKLRKVENDEFSPTITQMSSVSKVGVGEDIDISDNTQEGYLKSAILSGQTLVNLIDYTEFPYSSNIFNNDFHLKYELKTNTTYTIIVDINLNGVEPDTFGLGLLQYGVDWASNNSQYVNGLNKIKLTTNNLIANYLRIRGYGIIVNYAIVIEGDYTNVDIPYFEGMQSVKMPVLTTTGKNLFDYSLLLPNGTLSGIDRTVNGDMITLNGTCTSLADFPFTPSNTNPLIVKKGKIYKLSSHVIGGYVNGSAGKIIGLSTKLVLDDGTIRWVSRGTIDLTNDNCDGKIFWIRTVVDKDTQFDNYKLTIQLEESSTATSYEPYKSNILTVNEEVELGSVGEVKDELNLLTGQLTQRTETRAYQEGDESNSEVLTDMTNTRYKLPKEAIKTVDLEPSGTNPTTQPYVWKDGHIQLSSEEGSLLPTLDYSVTTSRGGQILENTKHIAKQDKRIYDLEMLLISSSIEDAYQRLLLQNDVQVMSRMDETHLNPMRYYMLTRLIEEKMYEETDMLNKLDTFFLYGDISSDQYFELMDKIFGMEEIIEEDFTEEK